MHSSSLLHVICTEVKLLHLFSVHPTCVKRSPVWMRLAGLSRLGRKCQESSGRGKAFTLHSSCSFLPGWPRTRATGTVTTGRTAYTALVTTLVIWGALLTLYIQLHPAADHGRVAVARDAEVDPGLGALHPGQLQHRPVQPGHCTTYTIQSVKARFAEEQELPSDRSHVWPVWRVARQLAEC